MNRIKDIYPEKLLQKHIKNIHQLTELMDNRTIHLMEVCGTHTMSVYRHGIKQVLPKSIHLLSGPGCPVCVTPTEIIDAVIELTNIPNVILTTFGDIIKVPGSKTNLRKLKGQGAEIHIVYSSLDALEYARKYPNKKIVFIGVGFETTAPTIAATILLAEKENIRNYYVLSAHKVIPPAMRALVEDKEIQIDGFICPGHVSSITGAKIYEFLAKEYHIPCVVAGFESLDILLAIEMLIRQIYEKRALVEVQYNRSVSWNGNQKAQLVLEQVFEPMDDNWRGFGVIPRSGLKLKSNYSQFDAFKKFSIKLIESQQPTACICGDILRGMKLPDECKLYRRICTPENPIGPCMVSSEGACAAFYKYENIELSGRVPTII